MLRSRRNLSHQHQSVSCLLSYLYAFLNMGAIRIGVADDTGCSKSLFCHTFPGIWSLQATVLLIRVIQGQYRLGRCFIFLVRFFSFSWMGKPWAQLVFQLFSSIVPVRFVAGFILPRTQAQGRHVFSLCLSSLVVASIFDNSTDWLWIENLIWVLIVIGGCQHL